MPLDVMVNTTDFEKAALPRRGLARTLANQGLLQNGLAQGAVRGCTKQKRGWQLSGNMREKQT